MSIGAGWKDIINERKAAGQKDLEDSNNPEWTVYIARTHVTDHETGVVARGPIKIGRGKYMNNIQRGRNQGGSDFRVYARIILKENDGTKKIEKYVSTAYADRKFVGPQSTQSELYDFNDDEIEGLIKDITDWATAANVELQDVKIYI
jgi:hypothetical protein